MKHSNRRQLAGLTWIVHSPSFYVQHGHPVAIAFDGRAWLVAVRGVYGIREFASVSEAAALVADAWRVAWQECRA